MFLFDANFLIALGDADHVHHEKAQAFFAIKKQDGWATCPLTENVSAVTSKCTTCGHFKVHHL
jgi:predicted nucleic acid-binding protein